MKNTTMNANVKHFLFMIMLVVCAFVLLPSVCDAAVVGKFTLVEGTVDLLKGGSLPAVPARIDLSVEGKDVIRTKSASRAEVTMVDRTVLNVAQRSRIDISEYSADPAKKNIIRLDRGKVETTVEKKPAGRIAIGAKENSFELHTPNAVAGVRGTKWFSSYLKNTSQFLVKDDTVCVFNKKRPDNEICMPPDFLTSVTGARIPDPPRAATKADHNSFERDFKGVSSGGANGAQGGPITLAALPPVSAPPADTGQAFSGLTPPTTITDQPIVVPPPVTNDNPSYPIAGEGTCFDESCSIAGTGNFSPSGNSSSATMNGTYTGNPPIPNDSWFMTVTSTGTTGPFFEADIMGTVGPNNTLGGTSAGYWIDTAPATPTTGIFIGETVGTYNPNNSTWQANSSGSWIDTNRFINSMTANPDGSLSNPIIPAFEVGRVDLTGVILEDGVPGSDYVAVEMNNVIFFAPSNGQKPGIWATNNITGSYDFSNNSGLNATTILLPENVIALEDGDAISADFQFTQWQGNKWAGKVSGGGTLTAGGSSYTGPPGNAYTGSFNFKGGAAGNMTGTTTGTLTGTGAGTVK